MFPWVNINLFRQQEGPDVTTYIESKATEKLMYRFIKICSLRLLLHIFEIYKNKNLNNQNFQISQTLQSFETSSWNFSNTVNCFSQRGAEVRKSCESWNFCKTHFFTCENRLRYDRERARQILANLATFTKKYLATFARSPLNFSKQLWAVLDRSDLLVKNRVYLAIS